MKKNRLDKIRGTAKRRRGLLQQWHAKVHRLPAHLTGEDEWQPEQSGVRLSRVFGMVLGIHVAAIGGLIAYEKFRHQPEGSEVVMKEATVATAAPETKPVAPEVAPGAETPANPALDNPANDGLKRHVVGPQERLSDIAQLYGVDENELRDMNFIGTSRPLAAGMVLVIPNRQVVAMKASEVASAEKALPAAEPAASKSEPPVPKAELVMAPVAARAAAEPASASASAVTPTAVLPNTKAIDAPKPTEKAPAKKATVTDAKKDKPPQPSSKTTKNSGRVHIVKSGETAYGIARRYGVNVDKLVRTNNINPKTLRPGTKLIIP